MTDLALFDLDNPADDEPLDLRHDPTAWTSCRYCHTLTTAKGISNRGHGPQHDYHECDRMHELYPADCPEPQA
jgi:hypothetical protein